MDYWKTVIYGLGCVALVAVLYVSALAVLVGAGW